MSSVGVKTVVTAAIAAVIGSASVPAESRHSLAMTVPTAAPVSDDELYALVGAEMDGEVQVDPSGLGLGTFRATQNVLQGRLDRRWIQAAGGSPAPGTLLWPVPTGTMGRGYGSGSGNYHQAVDIVAPVGEPIVASADGLVGYSGSRLSSYGNVVLLIHAGGWVTLYAHASELLVQTGDMVLRGQEIAKVGDTGISRGPHLHYELIFRGTACDPAPLFRPEITTRRINTAVWEEPNERPREVRCQERIHHPNSRWFNTGP